VSEETTETYIAPDELDCWHERDPRCPHCGHVMDDTCDLFGTHFEHDGHTTEVECGRCERSFTITLHVEFTYTTERVQ
jgi:transcription elongation factor Elf1